MKALNNIEIERQLRSAIGDERPYLSFIEGLYDVSSLYRGYRIGVPETRDTCFDALVYKHFLETGKTPNDIAEALARTLHDRSISNAMRKFLSNYDERSVVGIMGGHGLKRTDEPYVKVALLSKRLTEGGALMISGGGPGAMEATHLGAWMAGRSNKDLEDALAMMQTAPNFIDEKWLDTALEVMALFPQTKYHSLGIPTWLYGHEPTTPFATEIAKYFENSIREDTILTIAMGGIIYAPGSAGTLQEMFQDATQNHYLSFGYASPMVFFGKEFWEKDVPMYPMFSHLVKAGRYRNLRLTITDDILKIVREIEKFRRGE
ncbi:MAG: hypothetical protein Q4D14_03495 [Bacteroidales bacterium]|nr:hypothetical protein [Bacteroidales bacterium]